MKIATKANLILIVSVILIIIAPFLLTRAAFFEAMDFSATGDIGDTIGGITSPIVGVVGAILVYLTLKAQVKANQKTNKQIQLQVAETKLQHEIAYMNSLYQSIVDSIDKFKFEESSGGAAIYAFIQHIFCEKSHKKENELLEECESAELLSILKLIELSLKRLATIEQNKELAFSVLIYHQFNYRIMPVIYQQINMQSANITPINKDKISIEDAISTIFVPKFCNACQCNHGLPSNITNLILSIYQMLPNNESNKD